MDELKPCPFCGGEARIFETTMVASVGCKQCGANSDLFFGDEDSTKLEEAVEAWNRRVNDG